MDLEEIGDLLNGHLKCAREQVNVNGSEAQFCLITREDESGNIFPQVATLSDRKNNAVLQGVLSQELEESNSQEDPNNQKSETNQNTEKKEDALMGEEESEEDSYGDLDTIYADFQREHSKYTKESEVVTENYSQKQDKGKEKQEQKKSEEVNAKGMLGKIQNLVNNSVHNDSFWSGEEEEKMEGTSNSHSSNPKNNSPMKKANSQLSDIVVDIESRQKRKSESFDESRYESEESSDDILQPIFGISQKEKKLSEQTPPPTQDLESSPNVEDNNQVLIESVDENLSDDEEGAYEIEEAEEALPGEYESDGDDVVVDDCEGGIDLSDSHTPLESSDDTRMEEEEEDEEEEEEEEVFKEKPRHKKFSSHFSEPNDLELEFDEDFDPEDISSDSSDSEDEFEKDTLLEYCGSDDDDDERSWYLEDLRDNLKEFQILKKTGKILTCLAKKVAEDALCEFVEYKAHPIFFNDIPRDRFAKKEISETLTKEYISSMQTFLSYYMEIVYEEYVKSGHNLTEKQKQRFPIFPLHGNVSSFFEEIKDKLKNLIDKMFTTKCDAKGPLGSTGFIADLVVQKRYTTNPALHLVDFVISHDYEDLLILDDFQVPHSPEQYLERPVWYCTLTGKPIQNGEKCYGIIRTNCKAKKRQDGRYPHHSNEVENPEGCLLISKNSNFRAVAKLLENLRSIKNFESIIRKELRDIFSLEEPKNELELAMKTARSEAQIILKEKNLSFSDMAISFLMSDTLRNVIVMHHSFVRLVPFETLIFLGIYKGHETFHSPQAMTQMYQMIKGEEASSIFQYDAEETKKKIRAKMIDSIKKRLIEMGKPKETWPKRFKLDEQKVLDASFGAEQRFYDKTVQYILDFFTKKTSFFLPDSLKYIEAESAENSKNYRMLPYSIGKHQPDIFEEFESTRLTILKCAKIAPPYPAATTVKNLFPPPSKEATRVVQPKKIAPKEKEVVAETPLVKPTEDKQNKPEPEQQRESEVETTKIDIVEEITEQNDETPLPQVEEQPIQIEFVPKDLNELIQHLEETGKGSYSFSVGSLKNKVLYRLGEPTMRIRKDSQPAFLVMRYIFRYCNTHGDGLPLGFSAREVKTLVKAFETKDQPLVCLRNLVQKTIMADDKNIAKLVVQNILAFWDLLLEEEKRSTEPTQDFMSNKNPDPDATILKKYVDSKGDDLPLVGSLNFSTNSERILGLVMKRSPNLKSPVRDFLEEYLKKNRKSKDSMPFAKKFGLDKIDETTFYDFSAQKHLLFEARVINFIALTFSLVFPLCETLVPKHV